MNRAVVQTFFWWQEGQNQRLLHEKAQEAQKQELGLSAALTHAEGEPPRKRSLFMRLLRFFAAYSTSASKVEQVQRAPFATHIGRPGQPRLGYGRGGALVQPTVLSC